MKLGTGFVAAMFGIATLSGCSSADSGDTSSGPNRAWDNGIAREPVPDETDEGFNESQIADYKVVGENPRGKVEVMYVANTQDFATMVDNAKACVQHYLPSFPAVNCWVFPTQEDFNVTAPVSEPGEVPARPCYKVFLYIPLTGGDYPSGYTDDQPLPPWCPSA
ncbi:MULTISPECIES: hypothetical protein [unclassified Rhodococcus (in: high G+C Gram-positive bacteria)]|uniref:hypothetical protein n=1 Tax=unclassified Rhodococcus (in: high G+C Gram-positive bacteria) TaxID=192944 RepID=UPI0012F62888|nr:hypothetical protein [Rhodococcus sp. DK17]